jgi:polar amino acid transport system substrate-binding protein
MKMSEMWAIAIFGLLASSPSTPLFAGSEKPALIMVGDNWCPYNCAPEAANRGYMVDILDRVLKPYFTVTYQLEPWTRAIKMVESGEAQLLVATPATNGKKMVASAPLGVDQSCFFVRRGNPWHYQQIDDLKALRLGVIQDYSYDDNGPLDALIANYREHKDIRLEVAGGQNALESNFKKLKAGRMDAVIENENVGRYMIQELKLQDSVDFAGCAAHHVATTHVAVSSTRSDAKRILLIINNGLSDLRRTGELNAILRPYGIADWNTTSNKKPANKSP